MSYLGYDFSFTIDKEVLTLPITPDSLSMKVGSNNKVVTLINEGDINVLKSPSLVEFEFDARFPIREYPYSRWKSGNLGRITTVTKNASQIYEYFEKKLMETKLNRQPIIFTVTRHQPNGKATWLTSLKITIEDFERKEDAEEGDDIIVSFKLKEYKDYGIKIQPNNYKSNATPPTTSTSNTARGTDNSPKLSSVYTVQSGDCLWNIAKAAYGDGSKYTKILDKNKEAIEADARKHGKSSSSNGHWIWPGLKLTIPDIDNAGNLKVKKLW